MQCCWYGSVERSWKGTEETISEILKGIKDSVSKSIKHSEEAVRV